MTPGQTCGYRSLPYRPSQGRVPPGHDPCHWNDWQVGEKSVVNMDDDEKNSVDAWTANYDGLGSYFGPPLWEKPIPYDQTVKKFSGSLQMECVDLDVFPTENGGMMNNQNSPETGMSQSSPTPATQPPTSPTAGKQDHTPSGSPTGQDNHRFRIANTDIPLSNFDPALAELSPDDLKPQPVIKKSKKQYIPDAMKDDRYWARRKKNNVAAKRSRDARRVKENLIATRASYLENENSLLRREVERLKQENLTLKEKLANIA